MHTYTLPSLIFLPGGEEIRKRHLTLLSVFTVFADVVDEFQNETGLCFWAA